MPKNVINSLLLTGGGARGAYQVGALKGLSEILLSTKFGQDQPFQSFVGSSCGALNIAALLTRLATSNFQTAVDGLENYWLNLRSSDVYATDWSALAINGVHWLRSLTLAGEGHTSRGTLSLLSPAPLTNLLKKEIKFDQIEKFLNEKPNRSLAINCFCHNTASTISFYSTHKDYKVNDWKRFKRQSMRVQLNLHHILASSAIPLLFPPVKIENLFFADGSLREYAPFSAPIHMGASKILMIAVKGNKPDTDFNMEVPTTGKVISSLMNAIMSDLIDIDRERLERINDLLDESQSKEKQQKFRKIQFDIIRPSTSLAQIALKHHNTLPASIRYFLKGLGPKTETAELASYILFEKPYIKDLIQLGMQDCLNERDKIIEFFQN